MSINSRPEAVGLNRVGPWPSDGQGLYQDPCIWQKDRLRPHASNRKGAAIAWNIASKISAEVVTIDENHSVVDAATLMAEEFVGSALITRSSKITGIFTERDLMMRVVGKKRDPEKAKIRM